MSQIRLMILFRMVCASIDLVRSIRYDLNIASQGAVRGKGTMELYRCGYCGEWAQYDELLHLPAGAIHGVCYHEWLQEELEAIDYRILVNAR